MANMIKALAGFLLLSMSCSPAFAQEETSSASADVALTKAGARLGLESYRSSRECAKDGVAVGGYDLISYRGEGGPRFGRAEFDVAYGGSIYLFESAENRQKFLNNPIQYLPKYGGWCAISMALGGQTCPDYSNFKIENGDLLFFELIAFTNGRSLWNTDPVVYRKQADSNYERFMRE